MPRYAGWFFRCTPPPAAPPLSRLTPGRFGGGGGGGGVGIGDDGTSDANK